ncbi:Crp/Fnr family transcriptional regulator [Haloimpatiens sp. FM7330]|uniref:Crp/Fnr family transcriptional regulator n=1 Tax=Haloimpatiens sp. FM7330 TaxID=3298610 RepID=UPI003632594A
MDEVIKLIKKSILFKGLKDNEIKKLLNNISYEIKNFNKNETIAIEQDKCSKIGIILSGNVEVQKIHPSGKTLTINKLKESDIFGEVIIFSKPNEYPATIISSNKSEIIFIFKDDVIKLCELNPIFLKNFMSLLSNKILMLNKKVKSMSYESIRQKIADLLLNEYNKQQKLKLEMSISRKEMAEHFGISRPSLSRELIQMRNDGIIDFYKKTIEIKNLQALEDCFF